MLRHATSVEIVTLIHQLERFEAALRQRFPEALHAMKPGLDDDGIASLAALIAPFDLPEQLVTLYRWHNGSERGVFAGWTMESLEALTEQRQLYLGAPFNEPPVWLHIFRAEYTYVVAEVEIRGRGDYDPSIWWGDTHDGGLIRAFDSLETLVATCADLVEEDILAERFGALLAPDMSSLRGQSLREYRLRHSPTAFTEYGASAANEQPRFPERSWPAAWLASLDVGPERWKLRGATTTIRDLIANGQSVRGFDTIRGSVGTLWGGDTYAFEFSDGTGTMHLACDPRQTIFSPTSGQEYEVDVTLGAGPYHPDYEPYRAALTEAAEKIGHSVRFSTPQGAPGTVIALRPID